MRLNLEKLKEDMRKRTKEIIKCSLNYALQSCCFSVEFQAQIEGLKQDLDTDFNCLWVLIRACKHVAKSLSVISYYFKNKDQG